MHFLFTLTLFTIHLFYSAAVIRLYAFFFQILFHCFLFVTVCLRHHILFFRIPVFCASWHVSRRVLQLLTSRGYLLRSWRARSNKIIVYISSFITVPHTFISEHKTTLTRSSFLKAKYLQGRGDSNTVNVSLTYRHLKCLLLRTSFPDLITQTVNWSVNLVNNTLFSVPTSQIELPWDLYICIAVFVLNK